MANVAISGLPEQTGKTDNDVLAIVDSGETTTSKIKVSTLLAGAGGAFTTATAGTANLLPSYMDGTEIATGNYNIIVGGGDDGTSPGFDNDILNTSGWSSIVGGRNNSVNQNSAGYSLHSIMGGENNNISGFGNGHCIVGSRASTNTGAGSNAKFNIVLGGENAQEESWGGATVGAFNANNEGRNYCVVIGGTGAFISNAADDSGIVGGDSNTNTHDRSIVLGGSSQSTTRDDEVVVPNLTITDYAVLDFASDALAAAGGIPLGGVYRTGNDLKIRIV